VSSGILSRNNAYSLADLLFATDTSQGQNNRN